MNRLAALLVSLVVVPLAAWADPPGRVGRLAWIEGEVTVFSDPDQGWERAGINTHLTSQNSVWTEPGGRAEVRAGSLALRLEEATQLDIVQLDDDVLRAHVVRGSLSVRVRYFDRSESLEITTPEARFRIRGNGRYRIDADPDRGESRLTVLAGNARLETAGGIVQVDTGRSVRVAGGAQAAWEYEPARLTALDEWAQARDDRIGEPEASRYVSPRMTGWEDLDEYGQWRNEPEYGAVWYPTRVVAGWAPYRYGRWTWVRPWGWTWVDDAPWGYAPFHYGRWAYVGNRWGWYPGRYAHRPIWAPALVGWVGRPGWSVSVSSGPLNVVGWYPLSPYDRYQPWYAANTTYVNNVNHVVIVNRHPPQRHDNRERGATVVARENFVSHRPVQNVIAPVPGEVIRAQPVTAGSAVLPPRSEWRGRSRVPDSAPSAPAAGGRTVSPRPSGPAVPAPGAPSANPIIGRPAPPAYPATPATPPSRFGKPVPAEPVRREPGEPVSRPQPAPSVPSAVRPTPAPQTPSAPSAVRPTPAQPPGQSQPVARGKPGEQAVEAPRARGEGRAAEGRAPRAVEKQPAPAAAPAPGQPTARSAEKPTARSAEKPTPPAVEKPARPEKPAGKQVE